MATTGKIVDVLFENAIETHEQQPQLIELTSFEQPDPMKFQNAGNVQWRSVQQHADIFDGFDATGKESGIITEEYPRILGTPTNDLPKQRIDDLRDMTFWKDRGKESGKRQAWELNKRIAAAAALQGSMFYRSNETSGFDFTSEGQVTMNERQLARSERCFLFNDRDQRKFAKDLAGRETIKGRPSDTWKTGQIGSDVSEFDGIYTGSYLPNLIGGANPATTVTADVSEKPEAGTADGVTGAVTNIDYRRGTVSVVATASYNVGDKISFSNAGTVVQAVGKADKTLTNEAMTFTIVEKTDATTLVIYPKPIALDDAALTSLEKQYANIDTQILTAATVDRLNIDASKKVNLFWDKSAIEVIGGTMPVELFGDLAGKKVRQETLANGLEMYMIYDGDILTLDFKFRIFTWYGITVADPSNVGVSVTYT